MKKIIIVIIGTIIVVNAIGQISHGTPYNFCSLSGIQYNPGTHPEGGASYYYNMWVTIDEDRGLSDPEVSFLRECYEDNYPGHTILEDSTVTYNCHGYSYSVFQGGERCNISWYEELCTNGYTQVQTPQKGDIAVIRTYENGNVFGLSSIHSSIVYNEDTLISKWGKGLLTKHHKYDLINNIQIGSINVYTYYRRVINTNNCISGPSTFNGTGTYIFSHNDNSNSFACTWSVEPADMFQNALGTGTTANLSYAIPFVRLSPKATLTFTFSYGCDNHYSVTKEIDLRIPTTTVSSNAISDGFVVDANAVVTVTGSIKNNEKAKTIVPVGTSLILDGGKMISNGDVFWQGIEVWGNSSMHQSSDYQGYLELKNGAVIENAKCAVQLWRPNYWTTTGGIIHATDATFRNNVMSVKAVNYTNFNPGSHHETSYNAYFRNCTFVVNSGYLGTETFNKHVGLAVVNGIEFSGCDFSADRSVDGVHQYCIGISAYDAGFTVTSPCTSLLQPCPEEDLDHSTFTGLCAGIRASSDGLHPRSFIVRDAVFNNNDYGIHAVNTDYPTIVGNDFSIGGGDYCDYNYGVLLDNVTGFCIEENDFHPSQITGSTKVGLAVYHSNGINDVYRNMFKGLSGGSLALGQNTNVSGTSPGGTVQGLTYTCNEFAGNVMDVMVLQRTAQGTSSLSRARQPLRPATRSQAATSRYITRAPIRLTTTITQASLTRRPTSRSSTASTGRGRQTPTPAPRTTGTVPSRSRLPRRLRWRRTILVPTRTSRASGTFTKAALTAATPMHKSPTSAGQPLPTCGS